jgi:hypothetical protein
VHSTYVLDVDGSVRLPEETIRALRAESGMRCAVTPLDLHKHMNPKVLDRKAEGGAPDEPRASTTGASTS